MKCTKDSREAITAAASGDGLRALAMRGMSSGVVVECMDFGQCGNDLPGFGLLAVTQKLREYEIIIVSNIIN